MVGADVDVVVVLGDLPPPVNNSANRAMVIKTTMANVTRRRITCGLVRRRWREGVMTFFDIHWYHTESLSHNQPSFRHLAIRVEQ